MQAFSKKKLTYAGEGGELEADDENAYNITCF
jgi:hypothetical protein